MSVPMQPTAWVRIDLVPVAGEPELWQASVRPYADAPSYGGQKRGGITEFGDAVRSLSDRSGSPVVSEFSFVVFDKDGYWRAKQNDPNTQYLTWQDVSYFLASTGAHVTEVEPRTLFRGQLQTPEPMPQRRYRISARSRLGTAKGPFDMDAPVMKRGYLKADWPNIDRELEGTCIPSLHGEESDEGTTNIFGDDVTLGRMIPTACGSPTTNLGVATVLPPPPAPTYTTTGSPTGSTTWSFAASVRTKYGGRTTLGDWLTITGLPSSADGFNPSNYLTLFMAHYDPALDEHVFGPGGGIDLYIKKGDEDSTAKVHFVDAAGNMFNTAVGDPFAGTEGFYIDGDDAFNKGFNPPPTYNSAIIPAVSSDVYTWFNLLRHPGSIISIRAKALGVEDEPIYAPIGVGDIGTDMDSGAAFILGPDGTGVEEIINGRCYFGFYALTADARTQAHLDGSMPFRVNLCGWPMDQAICVYQDVFTQYANGPNGQGYQSGDRLTIPSFTSSPTIPILQSTRFAYTQALTAAYLGTAEGYKATVLIDSFDVTWRSFIEQMNRTFRVDYGENRHGQILVTMPDDTEALDTGLLLREQIEILRVEDAGKVEDGEIFNIIEYEYDWHPIEKKYMSGVLSAQDPTSIAKYGERVLRLQMPYTRDFATAENVAERTLLDTKIGPSYPTIVTRLKRGIEVDFGEHYRVQHSDLITDAPMRLYLRGHGVSMARGEVRLRGQRRWSATIGTGGGGTACTTGLLVSGDDTVGDSYADATAEELATYGFVTDDAGLVDGVCAGAQVVVGPEPPPEPEPEPEDAFALASSSAPASSSEPATLEP